MQTQMVETELGTFAVPAALGPIERNLAKGRVQDPHVVDFVARFARPGSIVLDVGAYTGVMTVAMARRCPDTIIYAYEANPEIYELLAGNLRRNQIANVRPVHMAVYDGTCDELCFPDTNAGYIEGNDNYAAFGVDPELHDASYMVPAGALDAQGYTAPVSVIKIDAQGADLHVMRGAERIMREQRPHVVFEFAPRAKMTVRDGKDYNPFIGVLWSDYEEFTASVNYRLENVACLDFAAIPQACS